MKHSTENQHALKQVAIFMRSSVCHVDMRNCSDLVQARANFISSSKIDNIGLHDHCIFLSIATAPRISKEPCSPSSAHSTTSLKFSISILERKYIHLAPYRSHQIPKDPTRSRRIPLDPDGSQWIRIASNE
jgi:hypothetical protein